MDPGNDRSRMWKLLATGSAVAAGMAARNAAQAAWRSGTGDDPPENPADPDTGWGEAVAWTLVVGAFVGLARMLARRGAAAVWQSVEGELPPGVTEQA